ncbi:helicase RepA family protein [Bradyrhizobium barranii subsp. barranii]|uniref:AAA family ATPase n=1 Tax=Bradyrhizobium barranii subsp. barranii TaxID=2823807 RepID=A0A939S4J8_9BRAD|nr:AAA family ATPase [Bradyrhizobium barranii]UEM08444.1 helicase RepA family protein [Bradyrhizobium barranii subsp. barranii]
MSDVGVFEFSTLENLLYNEAPKSWVLENLLAKGDTSSWFGPPGSLKSAVLTDIGVSVSAGRDWRGYRFSHNPDPADDSRGVIYFALERAELTGRRIVAHAFRDQLPSKLPIAVISEPLDLLDPACVDRVVRTVEEFEKTTGTHIALIIIDTYSKAIAGGDEDKAQTQNLAAMNIQRIHDRLCGCAHIATIGHTGKNPSAGERGSNAKLGHVDMAVQISGDKVRTATIVKANDQPEGLIASFEMEEVVVCSKWSDGSDRDPYTVAILAAATPATEARTASQRTTGKQTQALDALARVITTHGQDGAVHPDYWKGELARDGLIRPEDKNPRATFARIRKGLSQHIFEEPTGLVRIKTQPGNTPTCPA